MQERKSGILLHITSLPGKYGIGTLGEEAYRFVDFLSETKQTYWQILPLGHTGFGNSPYSAFSAFAGNPLLIDLQSLPVKCFKQKEYKVSDIDYDFVKKTKISLLKKLASDFLSSNIPEKSDFEKFKSDNKFWLFDYAFFISLKELYEEKPFWMFDDDLKFRDKDTLLRYAETLKHEIEIFEVIQYFFFRQWFRLKKYANEKGIKIIGDLPLYVAPDSADVWKHPEIFMLDENLVPVKVAGVPPDYFSATGQLWGNPVYNWQFQKQNGYEWWAERIDLNFKLFDIVRIDHFRGLSEFWAIPFGNRTAEQGEWLPGPDEDFFEKIFKNNSNFIAEDLGFITKNTENLRDKYNLPGMKILQFAFNSGPSNPFLPHNYAKNTVVYTGTHDNDTSNGIFKNFSNEEKLFSNKYFHYTDNGFAHDLIKLAWSSVANTAIAPLQDLLMLSSEHRMNTPGTTENNWIWRFKPEDILQKHKNFLAETTKTFGRL